MQDLASTCRAKPSLASRPMVTQAIRGSSLMWLRVSAQGSSSQASTALPSTTADTRPLPGTGLAAAAPGTCRNPAVRLAVSQPVCVLGIPS